MQLTVVHAPAPLARWRGIFSDQNIVKCGATILWLAGRFSQIWNSSSRLLRSRRNSGNISACTIPVPAVSHCTSPPPKRAVAAQRIGMVDQAFAHDGHRFETPMRMGRKSGHLHAVVHAPSILAGKVLPDVAPGQRGVRAQLPRCPAGRVVVVHAKQERVYGRPLETQGLCVNDGVCGGHGVGFVAETATSLRPIANDPT
jgi:hypothetical protein